MILLRQTARSVSRSAGSGLTLLLLFVVLVPSIGLLWFVNRAAQNEQLAVRQKLVDAYRVPLVLAQERLQLHWQQFAQEKTPLRRRQRGGVVVEGAGEQTRADRVGLCGGDRGCELECEQFGVGLEEAALGVGGLAEAFFGERPGQQGERGGFVSGLQEAARLRQQGARGGIGVAGRGGEAGEVGRRGGRVT